MAKKQKHTVQWWMVSLVFHVAIFAAIIYVTGLYEFIFEWKPDSSGIKYIDPAKVQELSELMRIRNAKRMADKVKELRSILAEFEDLRAAEMDEVVSTRRLKERPEIEDLPEEGYVSLFPDDRVDGKKIEEVYDVAMELERTVSHAYAEVQALRWMRLQPVTMEMALGQTAVLVPEHERLDTDILNRERYSISDGSFGALKSEIEVALGEVNGMLMTARRWYDMLQGQAEMERDMIEVLFSGGGMPYEGGGDGAASWGNSAYIGPALEWHEVFPYDSRGMGQAYDAVPGRRLGTDAEPHDWMWIDKWYTIGPFDNKGRANIDMAFSPELEYLNKWFVVGSWKPVDRNQLKLKRRPTPIDKCLGVNLDMVHLGKYNRPRPWKWHVSRTVRVVPTPVDKYCIWYAYTELYSPKAQTTLLLVGSDDHCRLWVEGDLIYESPRTPQPWFADQDVVPVRLREGMNRVLFRLEQAGGTYGFSLMAKPAPDLNLEALAGSE